MAGRYGVLPVDDRFQIRLLGRGDLYITRYIARDHHQSGFLPEPSSQATN
jgi:hypothetical protein